MCGVCVCPCVCACVGVHVWVGYLCGWVTSVAGDGSVKVCACELEICVSFGGGVAGRALPDIFIDV